MSDGSSVSTSVVKKFFGPKFTIGLWHGRLRATSMMMPVAPIYENSPAFGAIREIRAASKRPNVLAVMET
jgi:hypothetical protein